MRQEAIAETKQTTKNKDDGAVSDDWTEDQTQLLIKAVNLFPAGTASRYTAVEANHNGNEKVAERTILKTFIYRPLSSPSRSAGTLRVEHRIFQSRIPPLVLRQSPASSRPCQICILPGYNCSYMFVNV